MCVYHRTENARGKCPRPKPIHIIPRGEELCVCESQGGFDHRAMFPMHVDRLMGATCEPCRKHYARRLANAAK